MKNTTHFNRQKTTTMKKTFLFLASFLCFLMLQTAHSKTNFTNLADTSTIVFKVNGTAACETTIETTISSHAGVISANWDATTKMITIRYIAGQYQNVDFYAFLALAGYDTVELRAKQPVYDALPAECKYTRDPETE